MSGGWLIVCGPSGAGKDAVIAWAQDSLARDERVVFARRLVTRRPQPGSDHEETSRAALQALHAAGGLAWYWEANGHCYGVRSGYREVARGRLVVVNGSREHAAAQSGRRDVRAVLVTADGGLLQSRLAARGREDAAAVAARLARNAAVAQPPVQRVIVNDGALEAAGRALRDYVLQVCR